MANDEQTKKPHPVNANPNSPRIRRTHFIHPTVSFESARRAAPFL